MIPKDSVMLLSYINLKLRDFYASLDDFCDDTGEDRQKIIRKLESIGYYYNEERNQFI